MVEAIPERHVVETPCPWCGATIHHPRRSGRRRIYCSQHCRQRAYEVRTVQRRADHDLDIGRITVKPGERVVEVVRKPRFPDTANGWERMLEELRKQVLIGGLRITPPPNHLGWLANQIAHHLGQPPAPAEPSPTDQVRAVVESAWNPPTTPKSTSKPRNRKRGKKRRR